MRPSIPMRRSMAAWFIRAIGVAIGAALAAVYLLLIWESLPEIDWPRAHLRSVVGLYILTALLLCAVPVWLFGWIGGFVAPAGRLTYDR